MTVASVRGNTVQGSNLREARIERKAFDYLIECREFGGSECTIAGKGVPSRGIL